MKKIRFSWFSCVIFHDGLLDQWVVFDSDVANPQSQSLESLYNQFHIPNQQSFALKECMKNQVFHMALSENRLLLYIIIIIIMLYIYANLYIYYYSVVQNRLLYLKIQWSSYSFLEWPLESEYQPTFHLCEALKSGSSSTCWWNPYLGWC